MAVCGVKNVGKTTFLTNLIPLFRARGLTVGVIKSDAHDFEPDRQGSDSYKLKAAGALGVAVYSPFRYMVIKDHKGLTPLDLVPFFSDYQIVLLEGGKNSPYPKIELLRTGHSPGLLSSPPHLAFCADGIFPWPKDSLVFGLTDYQAIADLIVSRL
ncbi:MAG: molybdopterin-guanine dinucleotide biosynthesis protein B [Deltaproteobacteria bacterium]|nr:molybdopterin-guanine dinucleotide biosynthesis protein B [Deltaproteobacteria bacterium]